MSIAPGESRRLKKIKAVFGRPHQSAEEENPLYSQRRHNQAPIVMTIGRISSAPTSLQRLQVLIA